MPTQALLFTIQTLPPEERATSLRLSSGSVAAAVQEYKGGIGPPLISAVTPGMALNHVVLLIEQNHKAVQRPAALQFGWGGETWMFRLQTARNRNCKRTGKLLGQYQESPYHLSHFSLPRVNAHAANALRLDDVNSIARALLRRA